MASAIIGWPTAAMSRRLAIRRRTGVIRPTRAATCRSACLEAERIALAWSPSAGAIVAASACLLASTRRPLAAKARATGWSATSNGVPSVGQQAGFEQT